jgi:hypothetical protein
VCPVPDSVSPIRPYAPAPSDPAGPGAVKSGAPPLSLRSGQGTVRSPGYDPRPPASVPVGRPAAATRAAGQGRPPRSAPGRARPGASPPGRPGLLCAHQAIARSAL